MLIVGLSGGIASGKTTISQYLIQKRIPVVDADALARVVVKPGHLGFRRVVTTFHKPKEGVSILNQHGEIDRVKLGEIIFDNEEKRKLLNGLLHPLIKWEMVKQVFWAFLTGEAMVVLDVPLLFETGLYRWMHTNVVVYCPRSIQLKRLQQRNQLSSEEAEARINSQLSIDKKRQLANHIIDNSGALDDALTQADQLIKNIRPSWISTWFWWSFINLGTAGLTSLIVKLFIQRLT